MPDFLTEPCCSKAKIHGRDVSFTSAADLGVYIGNVSETTRDTVYSQGMQLFSGAADTGGSHIWDYLKDGQVMFWYACVQF